MSQSDSDREPNQTQPSISQDSNGYVGGGKQAAIGNNNFQYQGGIYVNIDVNNEFFELPENLVFKSCRLKAYSYIKTVGFLFVVFVSWGVMGIFSNQAFPPSLVNSLIQHTFIGIWKRPKSLKDLLKIFEAAPSQLWENIRWNIISSPSLLFTKPTNDKTEAEKLNKVDSQYWLLARLAEILQEGSENFDDIFWAIRKLEEQRNHIGVRLTPLKQTYLKDLNNFQEFVVKLSSLSNKSKKHDQVEKILNELVQKYVVRENVSELEILELIEVLEERSAKIPMTQSLYNVWRLVNWMYIQVRKSKENELDASLDANYPPIRAWKSKQSKYHIPNGCDTRYPRIEKVDDENLIDFYKTEEEAKKDNREICKFCKKRSY